MRDREVGNGILYLWEEARTLKKKKKRRRRLRNNRAAPLWKDGHSQRQHLRQHLHQWDLQHPLGLKLPWPQPHASSSHKTKSMKTKRHLFDDKAKWSLSISSFGGVSVFGFWRGAIWGHLVHPGLGEASFARHAPILSAYVSPSWKWSCLCWAQGCCRTDGHRDTTETKGPEQKSGGIF